MEQQTIYLKDIPCPVCEAKHLPCKFCDNKAFFTIAEGDTLGELPEISEGAKEVIAELEDQCKGSGIPEKDFEWGLREKKKKDWKEILIKREDVYIDRVKQE